MPIERDIDSSKVIANPDPLLMAHGQCMFIYKGSTWQ